MNMIRAINSAPELLSPSTDTEQRDGSSLEGVTATVKLLLKVIQDHKDACTKTENDSRRMLRVAGMMTILDNVRTRIQTCQSLGKKSEAELRQCRTEVHRPNNAPKDKRPNESLDEKEKLRRELAASLTAQKSLGVMCSSLGKEKEIMAAELARKVHELNGMEELVGDLKAQNETLLAKAQDCAAKHKERKPSGGGGDAQGNAALQERNKTLSEQLLRSLNRCRSIKRKLRAAQEENVAISSTMEEMGMEVGASLQRIRSFKDRMAIGSEPQVAIEEQISELEHMFQCFEIKVSKHEQTKAKCVKPKGEITACKTCRYQSLEKMKQPPAIMQLIILQGFATCKQCKKQWSSKPMRWSPLWLQWHLLKLPHLTASG